MSLWIASNVRRPVAWCYKNAPRSAVVIDSLWGRGCTVLLLPGVYRHVRDRHCSVAALPSATPSPSPENKGWIFSLFSLSLFFCPLCLSLFGFYLLLLLGRLLLQGCWLDAVMRSHRRSPGSRGSSWEGCFCSWYDTFNSFGRLNPLSLFLVRAFVASLPDRYRG